MATPVTEPAGRKPVRVYVDGCFDMFHFGHANALRQARQLGDVLVVGVHNDEEITKHKGPPVMHEEERYKAVEACRWADEVVRAAPYILTLDTLDQYNCDFCVHGEDISIGADGRDVYELVKQSGRYRTIKRTEGVSTTDLVGRMLLVTRDHLQSLQAQQRNPMAGVNSQELAKHSSPYTGVSHFLPTTRKIMQFMEGRHGPQAGDRIVYLDGGFDLFHVGHTEALRQARALGNYLIVGVHDDWVVNQQKGANFPIMNLHERVLGVLSCRWVDEVIIGAPFHVSKELIEEMRINIVVHGDDRVILLPDGKDPYEVPKRLGVYQEVKFSPGLTATDIVRRIIDNRLQYEERNRKKELKELAYLQQQQPQQ